MIAGRVYTAVLCGLVMLGLAAGIEAQPVRSFPQGGSGCTGYVGPGDLMPAHAGAGAWLLRAYSCLVARGQEPALDIRRSSDNATCTVHVAVSGDLDISGATSCSGQTVTVWAGADTLFPSKAYDQSHADTRGDAGCPGAGCADMVQGTNADQFEFKLSCPVTGKPCWELTGAATWMQTDNHAPCWPLPYSASMVAIRAGDFGGFDPILASNDAFGFGFNVYFLNTGNAINTDANSSGPSVAATDNVWHRIQSTYTSTSVLLDVDGTTASASISPNCAAGVPFLLGKFGTANLYLTGRIAEAMVFQPSMTSGQRAAVRANQAAYWGI